MKAAAADPAAPTFTAIVLAGTRPGGDALARTSGVSHKCLLPVGGTPMLSRVLNALAASNLVGPIAISIDSPLLLDGLDTVTRLSGEGSLRLLPSGERPSLSLLNAVEALGEPFPVLVTTADHALLKPSLVECFIREALDSKADIVAGLASEAVIRRAYPDTKRTYLGFRDGRYSGCNLFAILNRRGVGAVKFWRRIEQDRKQPWKIARALGLRTLARYLIGGLTLSDALQQISRVSDCKATAVVLPFAEAAVDVDKPEDLLLVEEILRQNA